MRGVIAVGIVLWIATIAGGAAVGLTVVGMDEQTGMVGYGQSDNASVSVNESGVTGTVSVPGMDVGVGVSFDGEARVQMESPSIDERAATTGLCVAGLNSDEAPTTVDVENDTAIADMEASTEPTEDRNIDPQKVVERCSSDEYGEG